MSGGPRAAGDVLRVAIARGGERLPLSESRLVDAVRGVLRAEGFRSALVSLAFLRPQAMARLNRRHLSHAGATDVIAFGFAPVPGGLVVGDIYICPSVARANARAAHCAVREELLRLVVHGTLHVLGWDHPADGTRTSSPMWRRQERILAAVLRRQARK